jgi:hypothetical protein
MKNIKCKKILKYKKAGRPNKISGRLSKISGRFKLKHQHQHQSKLHNSIKKMIGQHYHLQTINLNQSNDLIDKNTLYLLNQNNFLQNSKVIIIGECKKIYNLLNNNPNHNINMIQQNQTTILTTIHSSWQIELKMNLNKSSRSNQNPGRFNQNPGRSNLKPGRSNQNPGRSKIKINNNNFLHYYPNQIQN